MTVYNINTARDIMVANGLHNVIDIFDAAHEAGLGLPAACALMEKESGGRNVYGHDTGGALSGFPGRVTRSNFKVFLWLVDKGGFSSNGVGPAQITLRSFFDQMAQRGLKAWDVHDNMLFGFDLLEGYFRVSHSWVDAGTRYNGSANYGVDLAAKVSKWRGLLRLAQI
jgi:hypothetical protein